MSNRYDKIGVIIGLIVVLGIVAGIFLYIGDNVPEDMAEPFRNIGNAALAGVIIILLLIIVIIILFLYSYTRKS